jgi:hypothetical protein
VTSRREFLAGLLAGLGISTWDPHAHPHAGPPSEGNILGQELGKVCRELDILENCYLPALLTAGVLRFRGGVAVLQPAEGVEASARLSAWQEATGLLARGLPEDDGRIPADHSLEMFHAFHKNESGWCDDLLQPLDEPASRDQGPLAMHWQIHLCREWLARERVAGEILAWLGQGLRDCPGALEELPRCLPLVRREFFRRPLPTGQVSRRLASWLPVLAEYDPCFAIAAIDFTRIRRAMADAAPVEHGDGPFLASFTSAAGAFVAMTLSNNHFDLVGKLLRRPEVHGNWVGFIPAFITAVLYHKVVALRKGYYTCRVGRSPSAGDAA